MRYGSLRETIQSILSYFILHLYRISGLQKYIKGYFLFDVGKLTFNVFIVNYQENPIVNSHKKF